MKQLFIRYSSYFTSAIIIAAFLLQSCGEKKQELNTIDKTSYVDTVSVETEIAGLRELNINKTFSGTLEGEEQANVVSKIPERIMEIKIKVGDYVSKGKLLFVLDKGGASSQFYQSQAVYLNAEKNLERMKNLFNEGAVSRQSLDATQTAFDVAKANFEAAKSTVEITSPLSGVITSLNVSIGDLANPQIVMATVANINKLKAKFNAGENDVADFKVGQNTNVFSELKPEIIQPGKIIQISKSADVQSRTFEVQTLFSNTTDKWFKPGMFCRVQVNLKTQKDVLSIPLTSIAKYENASGVFVINNDKAGFKSITTGMTDGKYIEVLSGLTAGEKIVTLGMNNLKNGTVVIGSNN